MTVSKNIQVESLGDSKKILILSLPLLSLLIAGLASISPVFTLGVALVLAFACLSLLSPKLFLAFILLTGGIPLAFLTQKQKPFFAELGGINVDGMRLIGFVFIILVYLSIRAEGTLRIASRFKLYLFFLFLAGLSIAYTLGRPVDGLRLLFKLLYPFFVFLLLQMEIKRLSDLKLMEKSIVLGGLLVTGIGLVNTARGIGFTKGPEGVAQYTAGLAHPNMMSYYFLILSLFCFVRYVHYKKKGDLIIALVFLLQMSLTFTRISIVALIVGLMVILFRRKHLLKAAGISVAVLGLVFISLLSIPSIKTRMFYNPERVSFRSLLSQPAEILSNIRLSGRQAMWGYAFENTFAKKPWLGSGLGSADIIIGREWERLGRKTDVIGGVPVHNEYLRVLGEMGLVGLLIFLLANLKFTRDMFRLLQGSTGDIRSSLYSLIGLIAIVCYLIISMTCNTFNWYAIFSQYAFAFMALAYKLPEIRKETGLDPNRPR